MLASRLLSCSCVLNAVFEGLVAAVLAHCEGSQLVKRTSAFVAAHRRLSYIDLDPNLLEDLVKLGCWPLLLIDLIMLLDHVASVHLSA